MNYKNYFHRGAGTPCEKMTHKENLAQDQNHF